MNPAPIKPRVDFSVFEQLDLRIGTIMAVEDISGSDKLMKLTVSFGDHCRTVLAGIKQERVNPHEISGKQALFVVNLPPRNIRGVTSEAMLFDLGYADGLIPVLALPEKPVPDGTRGG